MTPDELRSAGEAIFGSRWQTALARMLGVDPSSVRKMLHGSRPITTAMSRHIRLLLYLHETKRLDAAMRFVEERET